MYHTWILIRLSQEKNEQQKMELFNVGNTLCGRP